MGLTMSVWKVVTRFGNLPVRRRQTPTSHFIILHSSCAYDKFVTDKTLAYCSFAMQVNGKRSELKLINLLYYSASLAEKEREAATLAT